MVLMNLSCKKLLEEHPESIIVPSIFTTDGGLEGGIGGVYNDLRSLWGTEGFTMQCLGGTDEILEGASATSPDFYTYNPMNSADEANGWWDNAYTDINTLNAVMQYASRLPADTIVDQCVAQAHFLRAFWYYYLVLNFGDVPLHTTYITTPSLADSRQPMAQVYDTIISDLNYAAANLQVVSPVSATSMSPFGGKAAAQGVALYLLGKTYLTRGWSSAAQPNDFQQAVTIFTNLITNQTTYGFGLWQDYADEFGENVSPITASRAAYDYGKENMFVSDHTNNAQYGQYVTGGGAAGGNVAEPSALVPALELSDEQHDQCLFEVSGCVGEFRAQHDDAGCDQRAAFHPGHAERNYILDEAFSPADLVNDTRFYKTFQTVFIANTANISNTAGEANNSRGH